jgi:hypothetical protein
LIFPDVDTPRVDFYWGDDSGTYTQTRRTSIEAQSASTVAIADVNADGWLDLVLGGACDWKNKGRPTQNGVLLFGGPDGYSAHRSQKFESFDSDEQAIADLNKDGYLDMVVSNYHGYDTRLLPVFIYWGDESGSFSESRRSTLPGASTLRVTVVDFNADGWLDIASFIHQREGDHTAGANIFWGSKDGFSPDRKHWFPAFGVHFGERHNLGNIYDRRLEETYVSPAIEIPSTLAGKELSWKAATPHGTAVEFQVRFAKSREALSAAQWHGPTGDKSRRFKRSPAKLDAATADTPWMQYRAVLMTPDGGSTPTLTEVRVGP